jgi:hypothetical protein
MLISNVDGIDQFRHQPPHLRLVRVDRQETANRRKRGNQGDLIAQLTQIVTAAGLDEVFELV